MEPKKKLKDFMNELKFFIMILSMTTGFFLSYAFVWFCFDLPETRWALTLLFLLGAATTYGWVEWVART